MSASPTCAGNRVPRTPTATPRHPTTRHTPRTGHPDAPDLLDAPDAPRLPAYLSLIEIGFHALLDAA